MKLFRATGGEYPNVSERIKQVNLGGGAIGTGLSMPRFFIMEVVPEPDEH